MKDIKTIIHSDFFKKCLTHQAFIDLQQFNKNFHIWLSLYEDLYTLLQYLLY
jgi:hypothetical protein